MASASLVDEPKNCWNENVKGCAVKVLHQKVTISRKGWEVTASPNATFQWDRRGVLKFLSGDFLIKAQDHVVIDLLGTDVELRGAFLVSRVSVEKLILRNISGQVEFPNQSFLKSEALPIGFQNWYGRSSGKSLNRGVVAPWDIESALPIWINLMGGSRASKEAQIRDFQKVWKEAVIKAGEFYQEVSVRKIAAEEAQKEALLHRHQQRVKEQEKILQLYRSRVLDGEYDQ
ncbi:MAG: hypothetical protein LW875_06120 [Proteobacteria bacterium]|nr:hypothetical protein [Pseudomonadota bacterium]